MTIARVLPRTTAALDPGAIVASTAEATLRSLWAAPETKTAARGLAVAACAVAAAFPRPFATVASLLIATVVVLHASNALARPASLRRGALLLYAAAPLADEEEAEDMYSPYVSSPDPSQVAAASEHETPPPTDEGGGPILVRASAGPPSGSADFLDRLAAAEALDSKRAAG